MKVRIEISPEEAKQTVAESLNRKLNLDLEQAEVRVDTGEDDDGFEGFFVVVDAEEALQSIQQAKENPEPERSPETLLPEQQQTVTDNTVGAISGMLYHRFAKPIARTEPITREGCRELAASIVAHLHEHYCPYVSHSNR